MGLFVSLFSCSESEHIFDDAEILVSRKSSWRFLTDSVKSKYNSVTISRINKTRRVLER